MQLPALIRTKLYFPQIRSAIVSRPRLLEQLHSGLRGPLTLVSSPAGSGKTTLMAEWRSGPGKSFRAAWLALDENDNDLHTFLTYLLAALELVHESLTANTRLLVHSEQPLPSVVVLTSLVNDIDSFQSDLILALDDYHVITDPGVQAALEFLVANQPSNLHLVLLTRSDPNLPLARLRARSQMVEIRMEQLRFNQEEATQFLTRVMGLELSQTQVNALEARAEGWIVGLHMAALSMQGRSLEGLEAFIVDFTGSHRYIIDYLVGEVLDNLPPAQRDFLLKTAILERLSPWLCDGVAERGDSQQVLQDLETANLFLIPLDDDRQWYRYHHLFADVLRNRLKVELPDQIYSLHRRAAEQLNRNGLFFEAVEHAFAIADYDLVRNLIRASYSFLNRSENRSAVIRIFRRLPRECLETEPWLCLGYAYLVWGEGNLQFAEELLVCAHKAHQRLASLGQLPIDDSEYDGLPAEMLAFEAVLYTQKEAPDRVIELANLAKQAAPKGTPYITTMALLAQQVAYRQKGEMERAIDACFEALPLSRRVVDIGTRVSVLHSLGVGLMIQGKLSQLDQVYMEGLQFAQLHGEIDHPRYDLIYFKLADVAYVRNELGKVEEYLNQGFNRSERSNYLWPRFYGKMIQIQLDLAKDDHDNVYRILTELETLLERVHGAYFEAELKDYLARIQTLLGNQELARTWAGGCQKKLKRPLDYLQIETAIQLAYTYEVLDELDSAIQLAEEIQAEMARLGCKHLQLYALLPLIKAKAKKGDFTGAQACLVRALALGEPEGYIRVFLDQGNTIRDLLAASQSELIEPVAAYAKQLLSLFEAKPGSTLITQPVNLQPNPLSQREIEVLRWISDGRSNKEIANGLFISLGTVKRHTVNIFNKLDARNRTEAVAKARAMGLL